MKKISEMSADEKANLLIAIAKIMESSEKVGPYPSVRNEAVRVSDAILQSIV